VNLRRRATQAIDFIARRTQVRTAPVEWMVETTNRCNLACPMCPRTTVEFQQRDMQLEFFKHILASHPEAEEIWPYGFGEPLLNPSLFEFIAYAKQQKRVVALSSNAALLNEESGRRLLQSGLDYLILPVDGAEKTTYETNRYPAQYDRIESQIDRFLSLKMALGSRLHVTVQMIRMNNNDGQIEAFRRKWRRPGVDAVRVRDDLSGGPGASLTSPGTRTHRPCFFLWRGPLFVQAAGAVIPCPYYHGSTPFGDLNRQSAREIWASESMQQLRSAHLRGDLSQYPICRRCPRHQPHALLAVASFFVTTWHIRRVFPALEDIQRRFGWKLFE
jgi:radical SAM protein with 4Fe4S-binding SPASM domain